ncbi:MAG: two-component system, OmpR family, sensor kinase [Solirubrobacteraceae bacterium]|nr:two-component system, OmpR family, sensor kinase [Solirubrobacteraceae bacterium]
MSIRNRLALLQFAITLAAVGVVYFYVAPSLESNLRSEKLRSLASAADAYARPLERAIGSNIDARAVDREVRQVADRSNTRATLLGVNRGTLGVSTWLVSDSTTEVEIKDLQFAVATEAARSGHTVTGWEAGASGRVGEAAKPLFFRNRVDRVLVLSTPLSDVQSNVALVRRKILVAGAIALVFTLLAGYLVARALSLRVRRLEQTAGRVAKGDFTARFPVDSTDELGQLARALDDMQRQLAELDSARKRFIATASHELRTPIFSLGGFLELLEDEELDEATRRQFLGQVRGQVARLGKLATDLLDLSKLEAGSLDLRPEPTDLGLLARAVTAEFTPALAAHDSHLELRLGGERLQAVCDPERVAQIMRILIDNAITHNPPGTDIAVSADRFDGSMRLAVRDGGVGIKRGTLDRIFEPFFTSDDAQGSGLGLAIARELAERMNGKLGVDSVPGRTTFSLDLPA